MLLKDMIMNAFDYLVANKNFVKKIDKINYVCANIVYFNDRFKIVIYVEEHENYFTVKLYNLNDVEIKDLYRFANVEETVFNAQIKELYKKSKKTFGRKYLIDIIDLYKELLNKYLENGK